MRKLLLMAAVMVLTACNQTVQPPVVPNTPIVEPIKTVKINPQLLEACAPLDQLEPRAYTEKEFVTSVIPNWVKRFSECQARHASLVTTVRTSFNIDAGSP